MKREGFHHRKVRRLTRQLRESGVAAHAEALARGLLEGLWFVTATHAPAGDVGRCSDEDLADLMGWDGDPEELVRMLLATGWIDEHPEHRLVTHAWSRHADRHVHRRLVRDRMHFADGVQPRLSEATAEERRRWYAAQAGTPEGVPGDPGGPPDERSGDPAGAPAGGTRGRSRSVSQSRSGERGEPEGAAPPAAAGSAAPGPRGPAPRRGLQVKEAWERGIRAAAAYKPSAVRWELTEPRRKKLRALLREHPARGSDAFAHLVHGYIFRHRAPGAGFDPFEHFGADTLLRAEKRAERLEAYDEATQMHGLSPPFRELELRRVGHRERGAAPVSNENTAARLRAEREAQIRAAYEAGEIEAPTEEAMRRAAARATRELGERRRAKAAAAGGTS